jgi:hypothetical protein
MGSTKRVSVYEFSDHTRVALQHAYLINTIEPAPQCVLYIRSDCEQYVFEPPACPIRYRNKYWMMVQFFFEAAILGRKVLVTTGPEASAGLVKSLFAGFMKTLKNKISALLIVRDSKKDRGRYLLDRTLYSNCSVLAVESEALLLSAREAGYAPDGYLYPTPITHQAMSHASAGIPERGRGKALKVLITGSLDSMRRDYGTLFEALDMLKHNGVPVEVTVGGHCMTESAPAILKELEAHCDTLVARNLLTDAELDAALIATDAVVCLNRPDYFRNVKGSGAIGDAFFAGKKLLIHADFATPDSADSRFYSCFTSSEDLANHLFKARSDRGYLRVDQSILDGQTRYFSQLVGNWLAL